MTRYTGTDNVVLIPSEYKGKPVTTIGSYAFHNNTNLTSVIIPESITSIGFGAFSLCANLTNIILPENLTTLKETAFLGCTNLTQITLPESLITIGHHAFGSCLNLIIYVKASTKPSGWSDDWNPLNRPVYFGVEEVLEYNGMQYLVIDGSITITYYLGSETELEIPSLIEDYQVTRLGDRAFENCLSLASVVLPESLISVGKSAFSGCINLKNTSFPENLTIIEDNAFSDCTSLTDITFPESLATIEAFAFKNCSKLTYIILSNNLTIIKDYAFEDCINLTIYVKATSKPSGWYYYWNPLNRPVYFEVEELQEYNGMKYVVINGNITITHYEGNETTLEVPSLINGYQVTKIGDRAFEGRTTLTNITLSEGLTHIGKYAFSECTGLTNITLPESLTSIGTSSFYSCISLTSITIPKGVTIIEDFAFFYCISLKIYAKAPSKPSGWSNNWNPSHRVVVWGA